MGYFTLFTDWFLTSSFTGVLSDKESCLTGIYDLVAVLTHKGRSADSGHYVAWVKQESGQFPGIVRSGLYIYAMWFTYYYCNN